MKNKNVRGLLALVVVTALSFGVILGSKALAQDTGAGNGSGEAKVLEELDTKGVENIQKAVKTDKGYVVTVKKKGYASDIVMNVSFDEKGETVTKVEVTEQNETEGLGAKIADAEFLSQFEGVKAPVVLPGMKLEGDSQEENSTEELKDAVLADGTYEAKGEPMDGYTDQVNMTVKDGKITEVVWESVGEDGSKKSVLSENGEYVMTEDGPTWKEQAKAMAAALVENQSLDFAKLDEQGKTDAVSGVSISVGGFVDLAQQCMKEAAGITETLVLQDGTYEAKGEPADGYTDQVNMTVKDGKITEVVWESVGEDGSKKSVLSESGEYVMTEDGPTWKEQAKAMAAALVENQSLDFAKLDEQGKTDAVSGVSISVGGFVDLAQQCMKEAAGITETLVLQDGTYEAKGEPADGYTDQVNMTVKDGKITEVVWESVGEDGSKKSVLSESGEYVMTEDGPTWKEQAEAMAAALVENQSLDFAKLNEQGKTDAVSGVSISVGGFVDLAQQCLNQAAGIEETAEEETETPAQGTQVDAVSGATISSTAAVTGINDAYAFLQTVK